MKKAIDIIVTKISEGAFDWISEEHSRRKFNAREELTKFIESELSRNRTIRNIVNPDHDIDVIDGYVSPYIVSSKDLEGVNVFGNNMKDIMGIPDTIECNKTEADDLIKAITSGHCNYLVRAQAGMGKSALVKYIASCMYKNHKEYLTIVVNLRDMHIHAEREISISAKYKNNSVFKSVKSNFSAKMDWISDEILDWALNSIPSVVLLDGFDEVPPSYKDSVYQDILFFVKRYSKVSVIVTSRPTDSHYSWIDFEQLFFVQYDVNKISDIIQSIPFNENSKDEFKDKFINKYFRTHEPLSRVPLFSSIMLLIYSIEREISSIKPELLDSIFGALLYKHKKIQGGSGQVFYSDVTRREISEIFYAFSFISYFAYGSHVVKGSDIDFAISKAISIVGSSAKPDAVRADFVENIGLLFLEGRNYHFIHKSIQEFFCAKHLSIMQGEAFCDICALLAKERLQDDVMNYLHHLDRHKLYFVWLIDELNKYSSTYMENEDKFRSGLVENYVISRSANLYYEFKNNEFVNAIRAIVSLEYGRTLEELAFERSNKDIRSISKRLLSGEIKAKNVRVRKVVRGDYYIGTNGIETLEREVLGKSCWTDGISSIYEIIKHWKATVKDKESKYNSIMKMIGA